MSNGEDLEGRIALVTGGGRGIGRNTAVELAGAGMKVAVSARSDEEIERVAAEIGGIAVQCDVSDRRPGRPDGCGDGGAARPDRPPRRERRDGARRGHRLGDGAGRLVADVRGQRPRCLPLQPRRHPGDARARARPDRQRGERRGLSTGELGHLIQREQGGRAPLLGDAGQPARRPHPRLLHQPGARAHQHDGRRSGTTRPGRRPSWRRASCARLPQEGSTRSPAATSTPSTTTSTTSHGAQARSSRTT